MLRQSDFEVTMRSFGLKGGHLRRNYFSCDSAWCAATIFKRLRWRLRRKYFSDFERSRAIQIRFRIIAFQQPRLKFRKNIKEEDS